MENSKLKNKVVVVTGASAGVGRAIAHEFAKAGAKVALLARGRKGWKVQSGKWRATAVQP